MKTPGKSLGKGKYLRMPWRHNANGISRRGDGGGDADYVRLWRSRCGNQPSLCVPVCVWQYVCINMCVCVWRMCACVWWDWKAIKYISASMSKLMWIWYLNASTHTHSSGGAGEGGVKGCCHVWAWLGWQDAWLCQRLAVRHLTRPSCNLSSQWATAAWVTRERGVALQHLEGSR